MITTLDDFTSTKGFVFMSTKDPSPIVKGAVQHPKKGYVRIGTPEQARAVRRQFYVGVMEQGHRIDPKRGLVLSGRYFSIISTEWTPKGTEPMCSEIPPEVLT